MTASLTTLKPLNLTTTDSYTFANVTATGNVVGGNVSATGNITATYFVGNGSQLSGVVSSTSIRAQAMTMSIILGN